MSRSTVMVPERSRTAVHASSRTDHYSHGMACAMAVVVPFAAVTAAMASVCCGAKCDEVPACVVDRT